MTFDRAENFVCALASAGTEDGLRDLLADISRDMGFCYFALTHHVDIASAPRTAIRLDNYPPDWARYFDEHGLGACDPVHRASHRTSVAFSWSDLARMIPLTPRDLEVLELARARGIANGFTVPANVPGESKGSCSFAVRPGVALEPDQVPLVQVTGAFAFEAARRIWRMRSCPAAPAPRLTDRQRDCVHLIARGKTDWEISRILGVKPDTVVQYVKRARSAYDVATRTQLTICALLDGTITFDDLRAR